MKIIKKVIFFVIFFASTIAYGQMNFQDSTVQVISYWDLNEKHEYSVSLQTLKYTETDTVSNETITYDVEVSVIDSTENSYIVRWFYKNFKSSSKDPIVQKMSAIAEDISVDIKLDEVGMIQSIENWEEVRDYMAKAFETLRADLGAIPELNQVLNQMQGMYSTKASIEATAIQDAQQFHSFHGSKYVLNEEVTGRIKAPNLYDAQNPFDMDISIVLEELDAENNQYLIRSIQEVDSGQLTETTYNYLKVMMDNMGQEFIAREEFMDVKNIVETVSRVHNTGWVLGSTLWKEIVVEGTTSMEIRRIQMK